MSRKTILRRNEPVHVKPHALPRFDVRPTNYFRGMIAAETQGSLPDTAMVVLEDTRAAERVREQLQVEHEILVKQAVAEAVQRERSAAEAEMKRAVDLLNGFVRIMRAQVEELKHKLEKQSVDLAFEVAATIVGAQIEAKPESITQMVKDALHQLTDVSKLLIRVHPEDLEVIRTAAKKWYQDGEISTQAELRPDTGLARGDAMIESDRGITDARVSSQLARLKSEAGRTG